MTINGQSLRDTGYDQWFYVRDDHTPIEGNCLVLNFRDEKRGLDKWDCEDNSQLISNFICEKTTQNVMKRINDLLQQNKETKETILKELQQNSTLEFSERIRGK